MKAKKTQRGPFLRRTELKPQRVVRRTTVKGAADRFAKFSSHLARQWANKPCNARGIFCVISSTTRQ